MQRLLSSALALVISAAVLWWLLTDEVIAALARSLPGARLWQLVLAVLLMPVIQAVRAWRFALLAAGGLPFWTMYGIAAKLVLFNFLLPFKLGELSFPVMMKQALGMGYARSTGLLILVRGMDLCAVSAILALCAAILLPPASLGWSRSVLVLGGAAALLLLFGALDAVTLVRRLATRLPALARWSRAEGWLAPPDGHRFLVVVATLVIWLGHAVIGYLAATAIVAGLDVLPVMLAAAANNLAFALPVPAVAGLGPPQAAWAMALHLTDVPWDIGAATALVCHAVLLIGVVVVGSLAFAMPTRLSPAPGGSAS